MQLHQKMRADRDVEGFRQMRRLQPGRDPADARDVDLDDRAGAPLQIIAEMREAVEALADRDGDRRRAGEPRVAVDVVEPLSVERSQGKATRIIDNRNLR